MFVRMLGLQFYKEATDTYLREKVFIGILYLYFPNQNGFDLYLDGLLINQKLSQAFKYFRLNLVTLYFLIISIFSSVRIKHKQLTELKFFQLIV